MAEAKEIEEVGVLQDFAGMKDFETAVIGPIVVLMTFLSLLMAEPPSS